MIGCVLPGIVALAIVFVTDQPAAATVAVGGRRTLVCARGGAVTLGRGDLGAAGKAVDARLTQWDPLAHEGAREVELPRPDRCVEQRALQGVTLGCEPPKRWITSA